MKQRNKKKTVPRRGKVSLKIYCLFFRGGQDHLQLAESPKHIIFIKGGFGVYVCYNYYHYHKDKAYQACFERVKLNFITH